MDHSGDYRKLRTPGILNTQERDMNRATSPQQAEPVRNDLIEQNRPVVTAIALRMLDRLPSHVHLDDVVAAGLTGLTDAAANFNAAQHGSFGLYVKSRVRGAIL